MTTWVENPEGGRERGPRGVARAWVEVLVRPRRFFKNGVAPGDQAPGLVFAVVVAVAYTTGLFAFAPGRIPAFAGGPAVSALLGLALVALLLAPAVLHLTAAIQTVLLLVGVRDRGGISQTVQVVAYATAPCALAGLPSPELRFVCTAYGATLLVVGLSEVHGVSTRRALAVGALPAAFLFGYVFEGWAAFEHVLRLAGLI
ncbi:YIP1 family protein [Halogeometricum luteum]|uniref:YIP1 family protein n=1 Tax=Halogeometricum luteum TaxID=2950537 RepID=A0ABU2G243_9EURY|nr:YIP1 family protein [Halogeometricum sp. S3BR5-2]MDS0294839.1 YIP1 family protein [Halogeometricum sp. S3BR5-2]